MKLSELFGKNLKYLRLKKGFTQKKLASATGFTITFISQVELGNRNPSFKSIETFSKVLAVKPSEFFVQSNFDKSQFLKL